MAKKLHGYLNLSRFPEALISVNAKGEKVIWFDIVPNKGGEDQYGNTHSAQIWDPRGGTTYLGNFKTEEFGRKGTDAAPAPAAAPVQAAANTAEEDMPDLPF